MKRTWLDKADGSQRPIGMPAFEDNIVQRAVTMLLGAVYEQDFQDFSHGFREGHSPHQALQELREQCMNGHISWIVDADVRGFFDSLDHDLLRDMMRRRVKDGRIIRLIGKWLKAGVIEGDTLTYPDQGTPQGGVYTPPTMLQTFFSTVVKLPPAAPKVVPMPSDTLGHHDGHASTFDVDRFAAPDEGGAEQPGD